jgi:tRNA threonylcarbamoyladenosine modification (KEOPS) complex  Pcc1 subunit
VREVAVECTIEIGYESEAMALSVARAIELDNAGYVKTEVNGKTLLLRTRAESTGSMLHTLEDLLACVKVADQVVRAKG